MSELLTIKPKENCRWDLVALGEVMLRLDPGAKRIHTTRAFEVWEGGGEYNVARGLKRTFGMDATIVTALADNPIGRLVQDLIYQGGVDQSHLRWVEYDGVGRAARNGLNFAEAGFGARAALGCSDRGNTAVSQLKSGDVDWRRIFGAEGARWFHTGGIFCALSETTPAVAREAMRFADENGAIASYDLNYRESLWRARGGREAANRLDRETLQRANVAFGVFDFDSNLSKFSESDFRQAAAKMCGQFPNLRVVASTLRDVRPDGRHDLSAVCFAAGQTFKARDFKNLQVLDRIGSGDAFAAGLIYGLLGEKGWQYAVECGAAHAALLMTTPGDNSMASLAEVEQAMKGGADVER